MFYGQFIDSSYSIEMKNKELSVALPMSHLDFVMIMHEFKCSDIIWWAVINNNDRVWCTCFAAAENGG